MLHVADGKKKRDVGNWKIMAPIMQGNPYNYCSLENLNKKALECCFGEFLASI